MDERVRRYNLRPKCSLNRQVKNVSKMEVDGLISSDKDLQPCNSKKKLKSADTTPQSCNLKEDIRDYWRKKFMRFCFYKYKRTIDVMIFTHSRVLSERKDKPGFVEINLNNEPPIADTSIQDLDTYYEHLRDESKDPDIFWRFYEIKSSKIPPLIDIIIASRPIDNDGIVISLAQGKLPFKQIKELTRNKVVF